jgi:hypothetical protein
MCYISRKVVQLAVQGRVFQLQESVSATGKCSRYMEVFQLQESVPATGKCSSYNEMF